jgi:hypothetical protein
VYRDRWEGRQSVGERDREDRGDLSLKSSLKIKTKIKRKGLLQKKTYYKPFCVILKGLDAPKNMATLSNT